MRPFPNWLLVFRCAIWPKPHSGNDGFHSQFHCFHDPSDRDPDLPGWTVLYAPVRPMVCCRGMQRGTLLDCFSRAWDGVRAYKLCINAKESCLRRSINNRTHYCKRSESLRNCYDWASKRHEARSRSRSSSLWLGVFWHSLLPVDLHWQFLGGFWRPKSQVHNRRPHQSCLAGTNVYFPQLLSQPCWQLVSHRVLLTTCRQGLRSLQK